MKQPWNLEIIEFFDLKIFVGRIFFLVMKRHSKTPLEISEYAIPGVNLRKENVICFPTSDERWKGATTVESSRTLTGRIWLFDVFNYFTGFDVLRVFFNGLDEKTDGLKRKDRTQGVFVYLR